MYNRRFKYWTLSLLNILDIIYFINWNNVWKFHNIIITYINIYQTYAPSTYRGISVQQCQEKRQEGKNEEKWIGTEGESIYLNPGNWCTYGGKTGEFMIDMNMDVLGLSQRGKVEIYKSGVRERARGNSSTLGRVDEVRCRKKDSWESNLGWGERKRLRLLRVIHTLEEEYKWKVLRYLKKSRGRVSRCIIRWSHKEKLLEAIRVIETDTNIPYR